MNALSFLFKRDTKKYLGRWTVDYCDRVLHTKVLLANQDHCGTCETVPIRRGKNGNGNQRYNEYINAAIQRRIPAVKNTVYNEDDRVAKEIEYYICMH
jgi:hypothetical protein